MNQNIETGEAWLDKVKLGLSLLIAVIALMAFYFYSDHSLFYRVVGLLTAGAVSVFISLQTEKGRQVWGYLHDAQIEVRKVVWPTRQETIQTTLIVILMVILVAIILWLLDMFFGWAIGSLIAHGG